MSEPVSPVIAHRVHRTAYIVAAVMLGLILWRHMLAALLAGLLIHELVYLLAPKIMKWVRIRKQPAKVAVVTLITVLVLTLLAGMLVGMLYAFREGNDNLPGLLNKMAEILETSRASLPVWIAEKIPQDVTQLRVQMVTWLREHSGELTALTKETGRVLVQILIGMIIGAMIALYEAKVHHSNGPLAQALIERSQRLAESFRQVVFAQVRIAALNTIFTTIYLAVILPMLGIKLPFLMTMILLTFLFGLLPVIGNIMSNTIIVIVSLSHSIFTAGGSLIFLVVIHKLEYFLNAKIIGTRIQTRAWEILLAMLMMESLFGIAGVIAAPVYYAYLKKELRLAGLV